MVYPSSKRLTLWIVFKGVDEKKLKFLDQALTESKYLVNKATYLLCAHYSESGVGNTEKYQVEGMLTYWLS